MKGPWVRATLFVVVSDLLVIFLCACALPAIQENHQYYTYIVKTTINDCQARNGQYEPGGVSLVNCVLPRRMKEGRRKVGPISRAELWPILTSVYDYFFSAGTERQDYGLYSYVLFPVRSPRAEHFLEELFRTTDYVVNDLIDLKHLNVIYLPTEAVNLAYLTSKIQDGAAPPAAPFVTSLYNYPLSRKLLAQFCTAPAEVIRDLCATDLSRGPYLFTYARPVRNLSPVPPPYLVLDLSDVHIRAFGEFIAAYKAQVKRPDYSDRERIDVLRLRVLNIVLTAADWIAPTKSAIADILRMAKGEGSSQNY